jgi:hypothetical protein
VLVIENSERFLEHRRLCVLGLGTCWLVFVQITIICPNKPNHLLWALMLLKRYCIESFNAALVKVTEKNQKTFCKWSILFVDLLAEMPVVNKIINFL